MSDTNTPPIQVPLNKASFNKFVMVLTLPPILMGLNTSSTKDRSGKTINLNALQFAVHGTVVPPSTVPHVDVRYGGQTAKVTSHSRPAYPNINVGFVIDNRFINYWVIWKWLSVLNDEKLSMYNKENYEGIKAMPNYHQYMTDITVLAKDEYDVSVAEFRYNKAFVTRLEGIDYSYQNPTQIESKFEFAFGQFEMNLL